MADTRSQLVALAKLGAEAATKSSLPAPEKSRLKAAVAAYVQAMQKEAGDYADLLRQHDAQRAAREALDAKDKALCAAVKAAIKRRHGSAADGALRTVIAEALKKAPNDASVKALKEAQTRLGMDLFDYSKFQDLPGW